MGPALVVVNKYELSDLEKELVSCLLHYMHEDDATELFEEFSQDFLDDLQHEILKRKGYEGSPGEITEFDKNYNHIH